MTDAICGRQPEPRFGDDVAMVLALAAREATQWGPAGVAVVHRVARALLEKRRIDQRQRPSPHLLGSQPGRSHAIGRRRRSSRLPAGERHARARPSLPPFPPQPRVPPLARVPRLARVVWLRRLRRVPRLVRRRLPRAPRRRAGPRPVSAATADRLQAAVRRRPPGGDVAVRRRPLAHHRRDRPDRDRPRRRRRARRCSPALRAAAARPSRTSSRSSACSSPPSKPTSACVVSPTSQACSTTSSGTSRRRWRTTTRS